MSEGKKPNKSVIMKALDYSYEKAIDGIPGFDSASELAESYMKNGKDPAKNANALIRWQISKAGTSGFLTGLGGLITMPFTIPANLASVIYVQVRMIAAIAHMGGYDLRDDKVKALVYTCMAGNGAKDILKDTGITIGKKLTDLAINTISGKTINLINRRVGFKLLTKYGTKGTINLSRSIPLMGGVIGGSIDSVGTNIIGNIARKTFIESK